MFQWKKKQLKIRPELKQVYDKAISINDSLLTEFEKQNTGKIHLAEKNGYRNGKLDTLEYVIENCSLSQNSLDKLIKIHTEMTKDDKNRI